MKNLAGNLHAPPGAARNILSLRQTFSSTYTGRFPDMEFPLGGVRYAEVEKGVLFSLFPIIEPLAKFKNSEEIRYNGSIVVKDIAQEDSFERGCLFSCLASLFKT